MLQALLVKVLTHLWKKFAEDLGNGEDPHALKFAKNYICTCFFVTGLSGLKTSHKTPTHHVSVHQIPVFDPESINSNTISKTSLDLRLVGQVREPIKIKGFSGVLVVQAKLVPNGFRSRHRHPLNRYLRQRMWVTQVVVEPPSLKTVYEEHVYADINIHYLLHNSFSVQTKPLHTCDVTCWVDIDDQTNADMWRDSVPWRNAIWLICVRHDSCTCVS